VFGVCTFKGQLNTAAIFEWAIAFIFTFYIFSFFFDLLPATYNKNCIKNATAIPMSQDETSAQRDRSHQSFRMSNGAQDEA
jgi:hypothetical protein